MTLATIVRAAFKSSVLIGLTARLTVCVLVATATTAAPAAAQPHPPAPGRQRVTLPGMWADVLLPANVVAGEPLFILVDLIPHDGPYPIPGQRVTLDLAATGVQRTSVLYDVVGDGVPELEHYSRVPVYAPPGEVMLRFTASGNDGRGGTFELPLRILPAADADADGLPDLWEIQFRLSPAIATGVDGPDGDPDGDGIGNRDEFLRRSHPRGRYTRYFPEGVRSGFFEHALTAAPASGISGTLLLRAFDDDGLAEAVVQSDIIPGPFGSPLDLSPRTATGSFAQMVESDVPFAATRSTTWPANGSGAPFAYGSHASEGTPMLSTRWLFAEGVTGPFDTYLLVMNPSTEAATFTVTYIGTEGASPVVRHHTIGPERRATIAVNADAAGLVSTDTAIIVEATLPVAAERSIYFHAGGQPWGAGTSSIGVTSAAGQWYFAEGLVNSAFDTYLLLLNPGEETALVAIDVLRGDGLGPLLIERAVPPRTRVTVHLNTAHPELARSTSFGLVVRSENGVPIVAERTMWWDDPVHGTNWVEGHTSAGASALSTRWSAGGVWAAAGSGSWSDFLLVANPGNENATIRISRPRGYGAVPEQTITVPPRSRVTLDLATGFVPAITLTGSPVLVECLDPLPAPVIVERSMYASTPGAVWSLGSNTPLTPLPNP